MIRRIKNLKHFLEAMAAVIINCYPAGNLKVIAVTGTDGKTTTVNLLHHLLVNCGVKTAMISTTAAKINDNEVFSTLHTTTPSPLIIQKFLKRALKDGCTHVIIETSSHAIDQARIFGCNIKTAILTNITPEHLDYHKTYENYLGTKVSMLKKAKVRIYNRDDRSFEKVNQILKNESGKRNITYGINNPADISASDINSQANGSEFMLNYNKEKLKAETQLPGLFNIENSLAAMAAASEEVNSLEKIIKALSTFSGVPGRMEKINAGQSFSIYIDFALTPGAFEKVLPEVRKITQKKLIHVFGAAGDRDKSKRPVLGQRSAEYSDLVILTTDDTHSESLDEIIVQIETGLKSAGWQEGDINDLSGEQKQRYLVIKDRRRALEFALKGAREGDTVFVSGMGHQTTMNIAGREIPWSDKTEILSLLSAK